MHQYTIQAIYHQDNTMLGDGPPQMVSTFASKAYWRRLSTSYTWKPKQRKQEDNPDYFVALE